MTIFFFLEVERSEKKGVDFPMCILTHLVNYTTTSKYIYIYIYICIIFSLIDESETQKRAVVDGSVHGGTIGGVRARERVSFDV